MVSKPRCKVWTAPWLREEQGQSSVEYALVLFAFVAVVCALGALWHTGREGKLLRLTLEAASRSITGGLEAVQGILLF